MNRRKVDVTVIGGGPAGLTVATELRRLGVERVVILEREFEAGGVPRHCGHPTFGLLDKKRLMTGPKYARRLVAQAHASGAEIHINTTALDIGAHGERNVVTTSPSGLVTWEAGAIVLAPGCRERPASARLIPGIRGSGILTTGQLQRLTYGHGKKVGSRALVLGEEHVSVSAVMTLLHSGVEIAGLVSPSARHQTTKPLRFIATGFRSFPTFLGHRIVEVVGSRQIDGAVIEDSTGVRKEIPCDTVIVTGDWVAEGSLAIASGANSDIRGGGRPIVDDRGQTSRLGLFAAGGVVRPGETSYQAVKAGALVAKSAEAFLRGDLDQGQPQKHLTFRSPIRWIAPQVIYPGQSGPIRIRVSQQLNAGVIVANVGGRIIDSMKLSRMIPGQTYVLDRAWCKSVLAAAGDELGLSIEDAT